MAFALVLLLLLFLLVLGRSRLCGSLSIYLGLFRLIFGRGRILRGGIFCSKVSIGKDCKICALGDSRQLPLLSNDTLDPISDSFSNCKLDKSMLVLSGPCSTSWAVLILPLPCRPLRPQTLRAERRLYYRPPYKLHCNQIVRQMQVEGANKENGRSLGPWRFRTRLSVAASKRM